MSRPLAPCGTTSSYRRHLRRGETPCAECRAAQAASIAKYRGRSPEQPRELVPCPSEAAYRRHLRRKEKPCSGCCAVHAAEQAAWYRRKRGAA